MKTLKNFDELKSLNKKNLINELLQKTLKGGCCSRSISGGLGI